MIVQLSFLCFVSLGQRGMQRAGGEAGSMSCCVDSLAVFSPFLELLSGVCLCVCVCVCVCVVHVQVCACSRER